MTLDSIAKFGLGKVEVGVEECEKQRGNLSVAGVPTGA